VVKTEEFQREEFAAGIWNLEPEAILMSDINSGSVLSSWFEGASQRALSLLSELIRIPTVNPYSGDPDPSGEAAGQVFVAEQMRKLGASTESLPVPADVYKQGGIHGPRERSWQKRENVVGRFQFGSGRTRIIFNAHMDTIGASDYQGDPFSGKIEGDLIYGRGSSDCKCGLASGLLAIEALRTVESDLDCQIIFQSVVDEECNGAGAGTLACCLAGLKGDYAIVLDGSAGMIYAGCLGIATAEVSVTGRSGHGSIGGVSALEKLLIVKKAIDIFTEERRGRDPEVAVNVGVLNCGIAPWVVPNSGFMAVNINYDFNEALASQKAGLGFCGAEVRARFEELITATCADDPWLSKNPPKIVWVKDVQPFSIERDPQIDPAAKLIDAASDGFRSAWGRDVTVSDLPAWCDASHLCRIGKMPVVGMGSGQPGASHTATEYNCGMNVLQTANAVAQTVLRLGKA
jgi:acetylornithine deacetylase